MLKNNRVYIIISLIIFLLIFQYFFNKSIKDDINENKVETVAKVIKVKIGGKIKCSVVYKFKYLNKFYEHSKSVSCDDYKNYENKYYRVIFSSKDLERSFLLLDEEIKYSSVPDNLKEIF
ncbi:hypothetical protein [Mariniflexile maritimum]|jgi:hypothetical protein|uniref:hypothetical protein n=1 Tax=Mariniflexile maritimum TaxID=2682493 RepID=UPI0012F653BF|nr:hypothetical protein [Mariniflexile maritimum]